MTQQVTEAAQEPSHRLPVILVLSVFLPFACGYYLSYVYRSISAVIAPNLVADVQLRASDLGLLTSMYFLAFAVFQLPLGLLLDRFGPRRVEAILLLFAAVGALVFAVADGLSELALGRTLIGIGVSCCMMAAFKAFALWFAPERLPMVNGFLLTFGALGALSATVPVEWLLSIAGWRTLFVGLAALTGVIAALVFLVVPDHKEAPIHGSLADQLRGLRKIFRDPFFWRIAPVASVAQGSSLAVMSLWAGPWLRDVAGFGRVDVADHLMVAAAAMGVGFFVSGLLAERLSRIGVKPLWIAGGGMTAFAVVMALLASGVQQHVALLFAGIGFLGSMGSLSYSILSQHFDRHLVGRCNTALNLLVFVMAFSLQWGLGIVLGFWEDPISQTYALEGYQRAFGGLVLLQTASLVWFFLPRHGRRR